jgi:hypothetical protein
MGGDVKTPVLPGAARGRASALTVVPYLRGPEIAVLLVAPTVESQWRLPLAWPSKGLPGHASAALHAWREGGVSGRVYKQPIRVPRQGGPMLVYPLVVDPVASASDGSAIRRWFPLRDAIDLVSDDVRPALSAFARRIARAAPASTRRRFERSSRAKDADHLPTS